MDASVHRLYKLRLAGLLLIGNFLLISPILSIASGINTWSAVSLTSDINPSCAGSNVQLTATITGVNVTGTVEFFDGAVSLGIVPVLAATATLNTNTLPAGSRSITAVYSGDMNNAASTSAIYIQDVEQVSANPTSATAGPATICNGQTSTLTLNGGGAGSTEIISWYTASCGGALVGTGNNFVVSPVVTSTYYGRYENAAPCNLTSSCAAVTVTVNQQSADPVSSSASATTICNGQTSTLTLNGGGGGTAPVIKWYSGSCGGTAVGTGNNLLVSPAISTTYYGRYENPAPCSYNTACASVSITVNQRPTGNITSPNTGMCKGSSTNITGTVTATGNWSLTLSNGSTASGTDNGIFSIPVSPLVTTTYTITALTDAVCNAIAADRTGSTTVTVRNPVASAGINQTICAGGSTVIGGQTPASGSTGPYTYSWSPATGLSSTSVANPTATPVSFPVTYSLIVTDTYGCNSLASPVTISSGAVTKNWTGSGSASNTGPDNNFNNAQNWSPGGVPASCNDVNIACIGSATVILTANATINSLNFNGLAGQDILDVQSSTLTINNGTVVVGNAALMQIGVNNGTGTGVIDFKGDVSMGTGVAISTFIGNNSSRLIFRKNLTMNSLANVATGSATPGSAEFSGSGAQTITWNTDAGNLLVGSSRFRNVIIGDATNSPTVTLAGSQKVDNILGDLTINNASILDLGTNQWNRNSAGGSFQLNGTATLKLAGAASSITGIVLINQGGVTVPGSNFPGGFNTSFAAGSTVEYKGTIAQTIYAAPFYGNLTLSNNAIKTAGGPLTAAGNMLINVNATFKANGATGWTHSIGGNWTNNGTFSYVAGSTNLIDFNGNTNASISGSSATNFHSVLVNKGTSVTTTLDVLSTVTTAVSPATLNFNNGLMRVQVGGTFTHNGAGPTIASTAGLHINGGIFNLTDGSTTNNGLLRVTTGIGNFGTVAGNSVNTATGGTFDMQGGNVNIAGRLVNTAGNFLMGGGTLLLAKTGNASVTGTFDMSLTTNMTVGGGTIILQNANTAGNDIVIVNSTGIKTFNGGLIMVGNASTPAGGIFRINTTTALYNLTVNNTNAPTARITTSALALKNDLTISGGTMDAATNNLNLTVGGNWVNNGTFLPGTATVTFNGTGIQSVSGSSNTTFYNLTVSNSTQPVSVVNDFSVLRQVTLNINGRINLLSGHVTLRSDATNTASIARIFTNNAVTYGTGRFIVERYIPNHSKAWQFLSVPTTGQTVNQAWQEGNAPLGNSKPGYGTIITSNNAGAVALGFDIYTTGGPTMKTYNPATGAWDGIASPSINIANPRGYMLFVRGDRSVSAFNQPATATILRTTGKLYTAGVDAPATINVAAGTFASIGNPYASAINFSAVTKTGGVQTTIFYLWDPKLTAGPSSAYGLGGYQTFSFNGSSYDVTPGGGSYSGANRNIESGQAFFVNAPISAGTVSFTEASKVNGSNLVNRLPGTGQGNQIRTNLYVLHNGEPVLIDGNLVQFDENYSNEVDAADALKLNNTGENSGITHHNKILSVERRAMPNREDTIFYALGQMKLHQYQFEFIAHGNYRHGMAAFLEDNYLHTSLPLSLQDTTRISFAVENVAGSYASDRFRIVFRQLNPVPVHFTHISATRNSNKTVSINWKIENEINASLYLVERSSNGLEFNTLGNQSPTLNNGGNTSYIHTDEIPLKQPGFYRIRCDKTDGSFEYSSIVRIAAEQRAGGIYVYPNPVIGPSLQLEFVDQPTGRYQLSLIYSNGVKRSLNAVEVSGAQTVQRVLLPALTPAGVYRLEITDAAGNRSIQTIQVAKE